MCLTCGGKHELTQCNCNELLQHEFSIQWWITNRMVIENSGENAASKISSAHYFIRRKQRIMRTVQTPTSSTKKTHKDTQKSGSVFREYIFSSSFNDLCNYNSESYLQKWGIFEDSTWSHRSVTEHMLGTQKVPDSIPANSSKTIAGEGHVKESAIQSWPLKSLKNKIKTGALWYQWIHTQRKATYHFFSLISHIHLCTGPLLG